MKSACELGANHGAKIEKEEEKTRRGQGSYLSIICNFKY